MLQIMAALSLFDLVSNLSLGLQHSGRISLENGKFEFILMLDLCWSSSFRL